MRRVWVAVMSSDAQSGAQNLETLRNSVIERVRAAVLSYPELLQRFSPEDDVRLLEAYPVHAPYDHVSDALRTRCREISDLYGESGLAAWFRLVFCHVIARSEVLLSNSPVTDEIRDLYRGEWRRILSSLEEQPDHFFSLDDDKFQKDLSICRRQLIPVGAGLVDPHFAIPKRFLLARGPGQFLRGLEFVLARGHGFRPYFRTHVDSRFLGEFTPAGWERACRRIGELLELNPGVLGMARSTWFIDPTLVTVSPRLAYLREMITENGGAVFFVGRSAHCTHDALTRSPTRRRLYEEGKYNPAEYLAIWPREALLRWARDRRTSEATAVA